ncbi:MAG: hypothetical protein U0746_10215 [Gemmataceae bacterium]
MWFFRLFLWWISREQQLCEALVRASARRSDDAQLRALEAEGFDVSAAREVLAALDAEEAPMPLAPESEPQIAPTQTEQPVPAKRPPGRPKKLAAPGVPFPNGRPTH